MNNRMDRDIWSIKIGMENMGDEYIEDRERVMWEGRGRRDNPVSYTHLTLPTNREV